MNNSKVPLFKKIDCLRIYVPDLNQGIQFYHHGLGLPIGWKSDTAVGFILGDGIGELVIQNEVEKFETDLMVDSVDQAVQEIIEAGGSLVYGPFDIPIGRCAVIHDPWGNELIILDSSKGTFVTDQEENIIGQAL